MAKNTLFIRCHQFIARSFWLSHISGGQQRGPDGRYDTVTVNRMGYNDFAYNTEGGLQANELM